MADDRFAALYEKSPSKPEDMTLAMTTDVSHVTEAEKVLLTSYVHERQSCQRSGEVFQRTYMPAGAAEEIARFQAHFLDLVADLYSGTSTWGDFNRKRRDLSVQIRSDLAAIFERARHNEAQRADAARQNAVSNLLLFQALQPAPVQIQPTQPRPSVNCTTTRSGSTAFTSCN